MTERQTNEALQRLNQGIEESRRAAQRQGMQATQEYFGDFIESLKQQVSESRSNLEGLPEQVPGGQEDSFQSLFQELMSNYSKVEGCLEQARKNVDDLDLDSLGREQARTSEADSAGADSAGAVEVEASETARREAEELGLDITRIRGTGSEGRVIADDVKRAAGARKKTGAGEDSREAVRDRQSGEPRATDAARREAEKLGVGLSEVEATGAEGQVIVSDVVEFAQNRGKLTPESPASSRRGGLPAIDQIEEVPKTANGQVEETAGEPVSGELPAGGSPEEAVRQLGDTASDAVGEAFQQPAQVTSAARRKAEDLGVDLSRVEGSGAGGLVTIKDVVEASR